MITAISNNFGVGEIQLKDFQKEGLVVLNGVIELDPSNDAYLTAQELEIKVSDLSISKSANAVVYLVDMDKDMPYATIMKAWIKDSNTICIEPCRCFDSSSRLQIIICSGFVAKGQRSELVLDDVIRPTVASDSGTMVLDTFKYFQQLILKDGRWGFMTLLFKQFQAPELGVEFSFMVPELPDTVDCHAVIVMSDNYQGIGNPICICRIQGKTVHCSPVISPHNNTYEGRFCSAWFVIDEATE